MRSSPLIPRPSRYGNGKLGVVLVAHGSRDPRAAESTEALARAVAEAHQEWEVHASYLDHAGTRPLEVLTWLSLSGHPAAVLVPLLLTSAYHGRVDVPAVVEAAREAGLHLDIALADVLGPASRLLVEGLIRRLPSTELDAVVLAAAGTRDAAARKTVEATAAALGARLGLPCTAAYASAASPTAAQAVAALDVSRVGVASYFLAPGLLYDNAMESARSAGAVATAPPLGDAPELVELIAGRVAAASGRFASAA